ncbi:DMT family transporter [Ancylomarina longa]|uniref:DMT family transporter n=1 Tax=Ancylomarina longa TaxID=2487017 RepID=A0A434AXR2_9BACT|nr:DMT family transporter [Ancylomarina longa]RUT79304.1 DMT family transporter [Ancylomarina longa]
MILSVKLKGSLLALIAAISFSNVYIFSKMAMQDINLPAFGLLWFGLALIYNLFYYWFFTKHKFPKIPRRSKYILLLIGCSELVSITAFFLSIKLSTNPAVVSFLANTSPIFVMLISFVFLRIRYSWTAILGVAVTLFGVIIMNWTSVGFTWELIFAPSSLAALVFAFFYGISLVLARTQIQKLPALMITICRTFFLFGGFILYNIYFLEFPIYTRNSVLYILVGSILGPFLGIALTFASLRFVDASITTLIGTSRSLFIIIGSFLFLNILPPQNQMIGGILTILGILIISIGDAYSLKNK